ncbi:hypothetical protein LTR05_006436 [Lithohypha guttulata]|uniref:HECT-type E3 ubiquitin transferase n=1 Tax=Lithohypha guttulata TaxID=1690604 RepID=A0AAN7YF12_9EURO|nr:hypothetical protein LTR05_006436 [Lithohypha guttulata]
MRSHVPGIPDSTDKDSFDPARDVPDYLQRYLIVTDKPPEIYQFVSQTREHKLRLLTRRFFNQIQYGCQNPYCDAPSCLSYRKRIANAPLRPHSDVTARTLAVRCVEQYASRGRDLDRTPRRVRTKTKSRSCDFSSSDGLCQNDPIVPWYADAQEHLTKRVAAALRRQPASTQHAASRQSKSRRNDSPTSSPNQAGEESNKNGIPVRVSRRSIPFDAVIEESLRNTAEAAFEQDHPLPSVDAIRSASSQIPDLDNAFYYSSKREARGKDIINDQHDQSNVERSLRTAVQVHFQGIQSGKLSLNDLEDFTRIQLDLKEDYHHDPSWKFASKKILQDEYERLLSKHNQSPRPASPFRCNSTSNINDASTPIETSSTEDDHIYATTDSVAVDDVAATHVESTPVPLRARRAVVDPASLPQFLLMSSRLDTITTAITENPASKTSSIYKIDRHGSTVSSLSRAYTFELLPATALGWLKTCIGLDNHHDSKRKVAVDAFIDQCLFYVFTDPHRLMLSAATWNQYRQHVPLRSDKRGLPQDPAWHDQNGPLVFPKCTSISAVTRDIVGLSRTREQTASRLLSHLHQLLRCTYPLPSWLMESTTRHSHSFLENHQLAYILALCVAIAANLVEEFADQARSFDHVDCTFGMVPDATIPVLPFLDTPLSRIMTSLADVVSHRAALDIAQTARKVRSNENSRGHSKSTVANEIISILQQAQASHDSTDLSIHYAGRLVKFMLAVMLYRWDRNPVVRRTGPVSGALTLLSGLYHSRAALSLDNDSFEMAFISDGLDDVQTPSQWLEFRPDSSNLHILQFPFLLPPADLVKYFRSINLKLMKQSHENALLVYASGKAQLLLSPWRVNNVTEVLDETRAHMARYFVMTVSRERMLEDAIGQIWRRERQELTRPLKVRVGIDEGELGLDHGGVQQEFFRLIFAEAFHPQYGMFETDPTTHMTWFKPGSLEPLYKFEALGILMSLAVYNGVTIPMTMPLALYRKILGLKVKKVEHIEDGWPDLARSFRQMLDWTEGDVGEVMCRTYEFSYESFGRYVTIDMTKTQHSTTSGLPGPSADKTDPKKDNTNDISGLPNPDEAPLVTNANRKDYVKDYILHLTDKSISPQLTAFLKGLHTLLLPKALSLFPPHTLKLLFEGHPTSQPLRIADWQAATIYEDYTPSDPIIIWFWELLRNEFTQDQLRKLLEFVTASNRIPVGGWSGVRFIIQRNAAGNEWLPGSSTCYGRLFLPEYSSKEILREKLMKAIETSLGFGMV